MTKKMSPVVVVDIGASHTRFALFSQNNHLSHKKTFPTCNHKSGAKNTKDLLAQLRAFLAPHKQKSLRGIGVSVAGPLTTNRKGFHPTTLASDTIAIVAPFERATGLKTFLLNDTTSAVIAIGKMTFPQKKNIAYITLSTGIGVGAIVDGHVLHGRRGNAGELGHATVFSPYTNSTHSWEHYIAGHRNNNKGIVRFYQKWAVAHNIDINKNYKTPKDLFRAHKNKHKDIRGFMTEVGKINAQGVANVMYAYDPSVIIFGGSIAYHNYDVLIRGIRRHIRRDLIRPLPHFTRTTLGDNISLYGVGYWTYDHLQKK